MKLRVLACTSLLCCVWLACGGDVVNSGAAGSPGANGGSAGSAVGGSGGAVADAGYDALPPDASTKVGKVTLRFKNNSSATVFIEWGWDGAPQPDISSASHPSSYSLTAECTAQCTPQCDCIVCDMAPPRAKKLVPGAFAEYVWDGHWYDIHPCGTSGCNCFDPMMVTPGTFSVRLDAAFGLSSGTPSSSDPTVYENAWLDSTVGQCFGTESFEMTPSGKSVTVGIGCTAP